MKLEAVSLVVCVAGLVWGNLNIRTNRLLRHQLEMANILLEKNGIHRINLGDKTIAGYTMTGVYVEDLATLIPRGISKLSAIDDSTIEGSLQIGLYEMLIGGEHLSWQLANLTNPRFDIQDNVLDIVYTILFKDNGSCNLTWNKVGFSSLDKVTMYCDNPQYNNTNVSEQWLAIRPNVNEFFKTKEIQEVLRKGNPCNPQESFFTFIKLMATLS